MKLLYLHHHPLANMNEPNLQTSASFYAAWEIKEGNKFMCYTKEKSGDTFIPMFLLVAIDRPSCYREVGEEEWKWNPIEMEIYDPIVPSASQIMYEYTVNPRPIDIQIKVLGPVGDTVEEWEIIDAEITSVDFGSLDWRMEIKGRNTIESVNMTRLYRGGDSCTIKAMIKYNYAKLLY